MWGTIQLQTSISLSIMIFVVLLGIYLILIDYFKKPIPHIHKVKQHRTLLGDEKTIFDHIVKSDGTIFQSKLVEDTGLSKVKITRILDRLEGKEIIDRKRRGMTNIVILKHK
jgi:uncharacterized membrane protein